MFLSTLAKRYSQIVSCETFESEKVNLLKRELGGNLSGLLFIFVDKKCWSSECYPNLKIHIIMMIKVLRLCINTVSPSRRYRPYLYPAQNWLDWPSYNSYPCRKLYFMDGYNSTLFKMLGTCLKVFTRHQNRSIKDQQIQRFSSSLD